VLHAAEARRKRAAARGVRQEEDHGWR
jgi:hypothetical protein